MERVRAGLRIPNDLNTDLIREANRQGISKNALILQILWEWVKGVHSPLSSAAPPEAE